jgi:hypothetical protein
LREVSLDGEYKIMIGIPDELLKGIEGKIKNDIGVRTRTKGEGAILEFTLENLEKKEFKIGERVKLCFSPTLLSNPFIINRKFLPSPSAVFWIPYALLKK